MKTAAVITVRMTSSRMPGKSMALLAGKPSLQHIIERMQFSKKLDEIIVATTVNEDDQTIIDLCTALGIKYFRGSEDDVLGRILGAAEQFDIENILYICGDCSCSDPVLADELLSFFFSGDYDYVSNCDPLTYPVGQNLEVFTRKALQKLDAETQNPWDREHVTEYFYTHPEMYRCGFVYAPEELERPSYRLCIDLPEDHRMMGMIFDALYKEGEAFTTKDIVEFLDAHPEIVKINEMLRFKKYKAAVVGLGQAGFSYDLKTTDGIIRTHCGGYAKLSRTKLDCALDVNKDTLNAFREYYRIDSIYDDLSRMLEERRPEIVSVATPTDSHLEALQHAAECESVRFIFCEKPLAANLKDAERMVEICRSKGIGLSVNYWMRFSSKYRAVRDFIHSGTIGKVVSVVYTYSKGLFNSGTHALNLMLYYFGEPEWVQGGTVYDVGTGDGNADGMVRFKNGVTLVLTVNDWREHFTTDMQINGTKGMIRLEQNGSVINIYKTEPNPQFPEFRNLAPADAVLEFDEDRPMLTALTEIVSILDEELENSESPGEAALETVKLADALLRSAENEGKRIFFH